MINIDIDTDAGALKIKGADLVRVKWDEDVGVVSFQQNKVLLYVYGRNFEFMVDDIPSVEVFDDEFDDDESSWDDVVPLLKKKVEKQLGTIEWSTNDELAAQNIIGNRTKINDSWSREKDLVMSFNVQGYMEQEIRITKEGITPEDLIAAFQDGSACTTCQEGGEVLLVDSELTGGRLTTVGIVISNDSNCEYEEFDSNLVKPLYPNGVCPDCSEEILSGSVVGEQCSNCEHVWTGVDGRRLWPSDERSGGDD